MIEIERKDWSLGLFIKMWNTKSLPRDRSGLAFDREDMPMGTIGLPTPVLMRIPESGGTISALTRRAKETASLSTEVKQ